MRHRYVYAVEFEAHFTLPTDLSRTVTVNDNIENYIWGAPNLEGSSNPGGPQNSELVIYDNMTKI